MSTNNNDIKNNIEGFIDKIKSTIDSLLSASTPANSTSPSCAGDTNLFPTEDEGLIALEDKIKGYKVWLIGLGIFIAFVIITKVFNPFQLTTNIIYMLVSTLIFCICITILIKSFMDVKNGVGSDDFINKIVYTIGIIASFVFMIIIFSGDEFKKNKTLTTNYFILFAVLVLACASYLITTKDDAIFKSNLPRNLQLFYNERSKYTTMFLIYVLIISILYFYDPGNIMTKYIGVSTFLTVAVGLLIFIMILLYHYFFTHPSKSGQAGAAPSFLGNLATGSYVLGAFCLSGFLIYTLLSWMDAFSQNSYTIDSIGSTILNYVMLIGMLGIIWKLANSGGYLEKNPVFRLVLNTILYIPCLVVNVFDYLTGQYKQTKQTEMMLLLLGLGLFASFFIIKFYVYPFASTKYYGQGGKSWVNEPIPTDKKTSVATYQDLNENAPVNANVGISDSDLQNSSEKYNYQYAISFWFYLDSFSPSTSAANHNTSNIVCYGENPCVKYDGLTNTLLITVKNDGDSRIALRKQRRPSGKEGFTMSDIKNKIEDVKSMTVSNDLDNMGNRIIYKHSNVLLQKWNNVIINYKGGTLDVFYNGELVKSAIEVVPYMKFDMLTVGSTGGISGNVANLVYFDTPIDYLQVHTLYNSLKGSSPPIIPGAGKGVIQRITEIVS
jgi:hypothetical protein